MKKPILFGKYLLLERINVGGMAEVFIAKAFGVEGFERLLAIKKILPTMAEDEEFIAMFKDEARISSQLSHANIAQIQELGLHQGTYFIAMEYVPGRDLRTLQERYRRRKEIMPTAQAAFIASKVCEGLDYAHRKKDARGQDLAIIHRDVSPQNILISYEGEVKLIDFGIAKAANRSQKTQAGILKGKFGYMSPEQVRGLPIDRRSDIFALGVLLYEMLTGEKLFVGESDFSTLEKVRNAEIPSPSRLNPNIPPGLEKVVLRALAREPEERYQWASDLQEDLMRFLLAGDAIYSSKHLSAFMREAFAEEISREAEKMERYAPARPEQFELLTEGHRGGVGSPPSSDLSRTATTPDQPLLTPLELPALSDLSEPEQLSVTDRTQIIDATMSVALPLASKGEQKEGGQTRTDVSPGEQTAPLGVEPATAPMSLLQHISSEPKTLAAHTIIDREPLTQLENGPLPSLDRPSPPPSSRSVIVEPESQASALPPLRRPVPSLASAPVRPSPRDQAAAARGREPAAASASLEPPVLVARSAPTPGLAPLPKRRAPRPERQTDSRGPPVLQSARGLSRSRLVAVAALSVLLLLGGLGLLLLRPKPSGSLLVSLSTPVEQVQVLVDGYPVPVDTVISVTEGLHVVSATAPGYLSLRQEVSVSAEQPTKVVPLTLVLEGQAPATSAPAPLTPEVQALGSKPTAAPSKRGAVPPPAQRPTAPASPESSEPASTLSPPSPGPSRSAELVADSTADLAAQQGATPADRSEAARSTPPGPAPLPSSPPSPRTRFSVLFVGEPQTMIELEGRLVGSTPDARATELEVGKKYTYVARRPGFKPYQGAFRSEGTTEVLLVEFTLQKEETATAKPQRRPARPAPMGELACNSLPTGAQVWVDGENTGRTTPVPINDPLRLPVGRHKVIFKLGGKQSASRTVDIAEDALQKLLNVPIQ